MKSTNTINSIVVEIDDAQFISLRIGKLPMTKEVKKLKIECSRNVREIKYLESLKLKFK